jgi:soluble lytic murein transglycosylase-like protein
VSLPEDHTRFDTLFRTAGAEAGLSWTLLKAQAIAESNLDEFAVSPKGACGISQFMPKTWAERAGPDKSPFAPEHAIPEQASYMAWLADFIGTTDLDAVVAAYNWGPTRVKRHLERHDGVVDHNTIPPETRRYIARIRAVMDELANED